MVLCLWLTTCRGRERHTGREGNEIEIERERRREIEKEREREREREREGER